MTERVSNFEHAGGRIESIVTLNQGAMDIVLTAARRAFELIASPEFEQLFGQIEPGKMDHSMDSGSLASASGADVIRLLRSSVGQGFSVDATWTPRFRSLSKATAKEAGRDLIRLNRLRLRELGPSFYAGTFIHEVSHLAGFSHDGDRRDPNQCTVPYLLGDLSRWLLARKEGGDASLPTDACSCLQRITRTSP